MPRCRPAKAAWDLDYYAGGGGSFRKRRPLCAVGNSTGIDMETLLGIAVGIGLSAACGFRVFLPLLAMNLASLSGFLQLSPGFAWVGSCYATVAFGTAAVTEVLAYYIPWLDHALDTIATPAAVAAGTLATASVVTDMSPFLRWSLALIAGGGTAGLIQGATVALRGHSTLATGGIGNPLVSTLELGGSIVTVILALLVPVFCLVLIVLIAVVAIRRAGRFVFGRKPQGNWASRHGGREA